MLFKINWALLDKTEEGVSAVWCKSGSLSHSVEHLLGDGCPDIFVSTIDYVEKLCEIYPESWNVPQRTHKLINFW